MQACMQDRCARLSLVIRLALLDDHVASTCVTLNVCGHVWLCAGMLFFHVFMLCGQVWSCCVVMCGQVRSWRNARSSSTPSPDTNLLRVELPAD